MEVIKVNASWEVPFDFTGVVEYPNKRYWYKNGVLHREDGPAAEYFTNGTKEWYKNGRLHREDGPASEYTGTKLWYYNGKVHRRDGPAIEYSDGSKRWYWHGDAVSPAEIFEKITDEEREKIIWNLDEWK